MTADLRGFAFPFQIDPRTGGVKAEDGDDKIRANIAHILLTNAGERVMRRAYGGGLRRFVADPNDDVLLAIAKHQISKAIGVFEPRVALQKLDLSRSSDGATLVVSITFIIPRTREVQSLSVPIDLSIF
jgi:uncharacterized protein